MGFPSFTTLIFCIPYPHEILYSLAAAFVEDEDASPVDLLDLGDHVLLDDFDDGTLEGLRRWNAAHEAVTERFYDPDGTCLIDPGNPYRHSRFLTEYCCALRERGKRALADHANAIFDRLHSISFQEAVVEPWLRLSRLGQEKVLLVSFAQLDRLVLQGSFWFARNRKLVPELNTVELLGDGGGGLVKLFDYLATSIPIGNDLPRHPIFNDRFFKKFGIPSVGDELPLSKAQRAFHQEWLMRRHSLLFAAIAFITRTITRERQPENAVGITNFESEMTRSNGPEFADEVVAVHDVLEFLWLSDERCNTCLKTAAEAGLEGLLYCQYCKEVDRIEPYCSEKCQAEAWTSHKMTQCGSPISTFSEVPIVLPRSDPTSPAATAHLPPLRRWIRRSLETPARADEFWTFKSGCTVGFLAPLDPKLTIRIRRAMRSVAFRALETANQSAVGLLAFCIFNVNIKKRELKKDKYGRKKALGDFVEPDSLAQEEDFKKTFEIKSNKKWKATLKRGSEEIVKPGNEVVKEYYDIVLGEALHTRVKLAEALEDSSSSDFPSVLIVTRNLLLVNRALGPIERYPLHKPPKHRISTPSASKGDDEVD